MKNSEKMWIFSQILRKNMKVKIEIGKSRILNTIPKCFEQELIVMSKVLYQMHIQLAI